MIGATRPPIRHRALSEERFGAPRRPASSVWWALALIFRQVLKREVRCILPTRNLMRKVGATSCNHSRGVEFPRSLSRSPATHPLSPELQSYRTYPPHTTGACGPSLANQTITADAAQFRSSPSSIRDALCATALLARLIVGRPQPVAVPGGSGGGSGGSAVGTGTGTGGRSNWYSQDIPTSRHMSLSDSSLAGLLVTATSLCRVFCASEGS